MPDKKLEPGTRVLITGNVYEDPAVEKALDPGLLVGDVVAEDEECEMWGPRWKVATEKGAFTLSEQNLSPIPSLEPDKTERGFGVRDFTDLYGSDCSIQDSSLAEEGAIWFGIDTNGAYGLKPPYNNDRQDPNTDTGGRMHLSQGQAAALLPLLQHFVMFGCLPNAKLTP